MRAVVGVLLVALVLFAAAAVVQPFGDAEAKHARAAALKDANDLAVALREALRDLAGLLPKTDPILRLEGPGVRAAGGFHAGGRAFPLSGILVRDDLGAGSAWRGPYVDQVPLDPWGRGYLVNLGALVNPDSGGPLFVVSAGEDGVFQTQASSAAVEGDDVGVVLVR